MPAPGCAAAEGARVRAGRAECPASIEGAERPPVLSLRKKAGVSGAEAARRPEQQP